MMTYSPLCLLSPCFLRRSIAFGLMASVFTVYNMSPTWAASSGWATTRVEKGGASGPYCAVSRQVDETVVTVGRTLSGQSSLALEMKGAKLDPKRVYRLSFKPGNADRIEIETKPLNGKTFVLNLDQVVDLSSSFSASPTLQIRYDDVSMALSLANWKGAAGDMTACLSSLSEKREEQQTGNTAVIEEKTIPRRPIANEDIKDQKKADMTGALRAERDRFQAELKQTREELETLRSTRMADRAAQETEKKTQNDLSLRVSVLESENERLRALSAEDKTTRKKETETQSRIDALEADLMRQRSEMDSRQKAYEQTINQLKTEKTALIEEAQKNKSEKTMNVAKGAEEKVNTEKLSVEIERLKTDHAAAVAEKNLLQSRIDEMIKTKGAAKAQGEKIAALESQIERANAETDKLRARIAELSEKQKGPDVATLQSRIEALTSENVKLRSEIAAATVPEQEMRVTVAAEAPLRQQLRDMRSENESLRARTTELMKILDQKQKGDETTLISVSGKNWDLEQATRRLQESEREVQRLSINLRDEKAQCEAEKKEIEYMLFDPKLAKDGQIALLNALEDENALLKAGKMPQSRVIQEAVVPVPSSAVAIKQGMTAKKPSMAGTLAPVPVATENLAAPAPVAGLPSESGQIGISALLKQAGITMTRTVEPLSKSPFGSGKAWSWETETLAGLAVEQPSGKAMAFDGAVAKQINTLKTKCKGDFAATPATSSGGKVPFSAYDAACIAGANSTSAALLFYQKDGLFHLISHESAPDSMNEAMDARDRLVTTIAGR